MFSRLKEITKKFFGKSLVYRVYYLKAVRKLERIDQNTVAAGRDEIRLFMVVRNEELRLPYLFEYYRKMGVERFFIIDNGSTDGTVPFLLKQDDTHVFLGKGKFSNKLNWKLYLLKKYGMNRWCVMADADEIFVYPHHETVNLKELAVYLGREGATAVKSLWIDMYSDKPVKESVYTQGDDFLKDFRYFDGECLKQGPATRLCGYYTEFDKTSFIKYRKGMIVDSGQHRVRGNVVLSKIFGAVLHFKFSSDFIPKVYEEAQREQYHNQSAMYKRFLKLITENPGVSLYYSDSVRYQNDAQLVELGIMKTTAEFEKYVSTIGKGNEVYNTSIQNRH